MTLHHDSKSSPQFPSPPSLSPQQIALISEAAVQYAETHGLLMNTKVPPSEHSTPKNSDPHAAQSQQLSHVPLVLTPTLFPSSEFHRLKSIAPLFSLVVDRMSRDAEFLLGELKEVLKVDEFTRRIADIYREVYCTQVTDSDQDDNGPETKKEHLEFLPPNKDTQLLAMGIHRSDYMLHGTSKPLQVELNTISSAFAALSQITQQLHTFVVNRFDRFIRENLPKNSKLEVNNSKDEVVHLMKEAFEAWEEQKREGNVLGRSHMAVLFIVQPGEGNFADQKHIEFDLYERYCMKCVRASLGEIHERAYLDEYHNLVYNDVHTGMEYLIPVAYYRAGYTPTDYPTQKQWEARKRIEESSAIKCPTTGYQLVGTKYIQYVMTRPGVLERYISKKESDELRSVFTGIYSMHDKEAVQRAIENPHLFLGKPQREGGGNLIYGENLRTILKEMPDEVRDGYILMDRIVPSGQENIFCRRKQTVVTTGVSELGTYCLFVGDASRDKDIVNNRYGGYLLRTKPKDVEDGGVASGVASMDSLVLV
eukprot:CAMPEP_0117449614 /NCGR_PEP_ID=MMETSP0759-20121206/8035_1 /TAXON_ID=63605 /ORGANISM="Percolomonas cosmopolitus, Strain WS" /LENGTH=535 /DNA_ID=CAMNT_0005242093 /DNA_START=27 /DNA_END=1634 /DNA_ORIENTATION=-